MYARDSIRGTLFGIHFYLAAGSELIDAVHNHALTFGEPALNGSLGGLDRTDGDRPHVGGLVFFDNVDVGSLRAALNRYSRNQDPVLSDFDQQADIDELVWKEGLRRVVEDC